MVTASMDDIPTIMNQLQSTTPLPLAVFIPDELITVIISFLDVKTITRFRCVCKLWNTLITNPTFIKMHLYKSSLKPHFILTTHELLTSRVVSLPISHLLENQSISVAGYTYCRSPKGSNFQIVGSCNGLLCLLYKTFQRTDIDYWFYVWNPTTRTISEKLGFIRDKDSLHSRFQFNFGFDYLSGTYKVVWFREELDKETEIGCSLWIYKYKVRVYSLGDHCWRNIEGSFPIGWDHGVHLSGTVNWITVRDNYNNYISVFTEEILKASVSHDQFVILSFDFSTETHTLLLLPPGFDEVPCVKPSLRVLLDCLCFSHDYKRTEFVIWQMKEFGVQESWSQLFRIEYFNLQTQIPISDDVDLHEYMAFITPLLPLYLSKNGDVLILSNNVDGVIIYNQRDKRVEKTGVSKHISWYSPFDYVESLVSTPWKTGDKEAKEEKEIWKIEFEEESDEDFWFSLC